MLGSPSGNLCFRAQFDSTLLSVYAPHYISACPVNSRCLAVAPARTDRSLILLLPDRRQREQIYFDSRKGIVAIAIRTGADIVPTYFLGQSQVRLTPALHTQRSFTIFVQPAWLRQGFARSALQGGNGRLLSPLHACSSL